MHSQRKKTHIDNNMKNPYFREAYIAGMNVINDILHKYSKTTIITNLIISYCSDGSNEFDFYDESGVKIENLWLNTHSKVTFKNEGSNQTEIMNRRSRLCVAKSTRNNKLIIEYKDESMCVLSDLLSVAGWNSIDKHGQSIEFIIIE